MISELIIVSLRSVTIRISVINGDDTWESNPLVVGLKLVSIVALRLSEERRCAALRWGAARREFIEQYLAIKRWAALCYV
jgi:hypothetical protein